MDNPFDQFDNSTSPASSAGASAASNPFDAFDPPAPPAPAQGPLTAGDSDGALTTAAKAAGTGAVKFASHLPGAVGDITQGLDYMAGLPLKAIDYGKSLVTGKPYADIEAQSNASDAAVAKAHADWLGSHHLPNVPQTTSIPSGQDISQSIFNGNAVTKPMGEYQPTSGLGKAAMAGTDFAGMVLNPAGWEGGVANAAKAAPKLFGTGAGIQSAVNAGVNPDVANAIGIAVGAGGHALLNSKAGITRAAALPGIGNQFAERAAARSIGDQLTPDQTAQLQAPIEPSLPGYKETTGQMLGSQPLLEAERAAAVANPEFHGEMNELSGVQNAARSNALQNIQSGGAPMSVATEIRSRLDDLDKAWSNPGAAGGVGPFPGGVGSEAVNKASSLGGDQSPEYYGNKIGSIVQPQIDAATKVAQGATDAIGGTQPLDVTGQNLRDQAQAARDVSRKARSDLYNAIDPDGSLNIVASPVRDAAARIESSIDPLGVKPSAPEAEMYALAQSIPDVAPFKSIGAFDTNVTDAIQKSLDPYGRDTASTLRLRQLKSAVSGAIDNAVQNQDAWEKAAVARGTISPTDTIAARLAAENDAESANLGNTGGNLGPNGQSVAVGNGTGAAPANVGSLAAERNGPGGLSNPASSAGVPGGVSPDKIYYPGGNLTAKPEIAELGDLVASHGTDFKANPVYPQQLQPRNRSSAPAQDQVNSMAARLQPDRLGPSPEANSGAPIVGPDNVVESGNGRALAIAKAYEAGNTTYPAWLKSQGYDTTGFKRPVLVQRRTSPMTEGEREYFAHSANSASGLRMSAAEQAASDAKSITPDLVGRIKSGDMGSAENRDFVRAFMDKIPATERGGMMDRDGNLSQAGVRRMNAAVAAHAYGDTGFISRAFDTTDPGIRNVTGALTESAGPWSKMRELARSGDIDPAHDVTPEVMRAVKTIMKARDEGRPVSELLDQSDMFRSPVAKSVEDIIFRDGKVASKEQIATGLKSYAEESAKNEVGPRLFGESLSPADILKNSVDKAQKEAAAPASEAVTGSTFAKGAQEPAMETGPRPNVDEGAAARLAAAKHAHADFSQTYKQGVLADVLKTNGYKGQYAGAAAAVPSKVFVAGPKGYETGMLFRKGVKNDPAAMAQVEEAAAASLRGTRGAVVDGHLTPEGYAAWEKAHGPALRAFPDVQAKFAKAAKAAEPLSQFEPFQKASSAAGTPELFFHSGATGGESVKTLRGMIGDKATADIGGDYLASRFKAAAGTRPDGSIDPVKADRWLAAHKPALDALPPDLRAKFKDAASATKLSDDVASARDKARSDALEGAAGKILNAGDATEVVAHVGNVLGGPNAVTEMRRLKSRVADNPVANDGLRQAVVDTLMNKATTTAEAGLTWENKIGAHPFQKILQNKKMMAAISEVLEPSDVSTIRAVGETFMRARRSVEAPNIKGSTNTAREYAAYASKHPQKESMLRRMVEGFIAGSVLGHEADIHMGPIVGGGVTAGAAILSGIKDAGMSKISDITKKMILDPQFAKKMLEQHVWNEPGADRSLVKYLRRMSLFQQSAASKDRDR